MPECHSEGLFRTTDFPCYRADGIATIADVARPNSRPRIVDTQKTGIVEHRLTLLIRPKITFLPLAEMMPITFFPGRWEEDASSVYLADKPGTFHPVVSVPYIVTIVYQFIDLVWRRK